MSRTLLPVAAALLSAPVLAGDVAVEVTGTVIVATMTSGPLANAQPGDTAVMTFEVDTPGTDIVVNQLTAYTIDLSTFSLDAGGGSLAMTTAQTFRLMNDFPVADRVFIDLANIGNGFWLEYAVSDSTGTALSSTDITAETGVYLPTDFTSSQTWYVMGGGGQLEMSFEQLTIGAGVPGTNYCGPAVANSTGSPATISATGSAIVSANDLTLHADGLPLNQFGYFLNSLTQGFVQNPGNSQGNLCLGGQIGRYNAFVGNTGSAGSLSLSLDLTQTPTPSGNVSILAGETWNFTCWFRDNNPSPTSNFTDGLSVSFL